MQDLSISRRSLMTAAVSLLGPWNPGVSLICKAAETQGIQLNDVQRYSLVKALKSADKRYDPYEKMIKSSISGVGYHTTLKNGTVHATRSSLDYAVALLDSGEAERLEQAKEILRRVIALQDQNPDNKTYGIWSWYLEEPLTMMSPPDWNWADFCGAQLLAAWIDHKQRLGKELSDLVRASIIHASNSIRKRNVSLSYTNIAIMGTYVTLTAADRFGLKDLEEYAKDRLRRYHAYIFEQGSFNEYNSPTYTIVAIKELSRMLMHVRDEKDLQLIREIHDFAWKHAAIRYHEPTRQWAGPHSRCYQTLMSPKNLQLYEIATGMKGLVTKDRPLTLAMNAYRIPITCPKSCVKYFEPLKEPRTVTESFTKVKIGTNTIGTTYLHPKYTLGTVNQGDFWNQRRPFVAYWGTKAEPTYLQIRFLHDGYDYCSALPFTIQNENHALTGIVFATDYGDTHPSLTRIRDGAIRAKDLRLRFEFGGATNNLAFLPLNGESGTLYAKDRDVQMQIQPIVDPFGDKRFRWEIGKDDTKHWIDAVAYSGEEKEICFTELEQAYLAFAFQIDEASKKMEPIEKIEQSEEKDKVGIYWRYVNRINPLYRRTMILKLPKKPSTRGKLRREIKLDEMIAIE